MFDIGWTELVVVACVAILVVGPKDLPGMLRTFGKTVGSLRRMAGDFQRQFNDALKDAEQSAGLDEVRKATAFKPLEDARKSAESFQNSVKKSVGELENDLNAGSDAATTDPAPAEAVAMPPAKTGPVKKTQSGQTTSKQTSAKQASAKPSGAKKPAAKTVSAKAAPQTASKPALKPAEKPAAKSAAKPAAKKTVAAKPADKKPGGRKAGVKG